MSSSSWSPCKTWCIACKPVGHFNSTHELWAFKTNMQKGHAASRTQRFEWEQICRCCCWYEGKIELAMMECSETVLIRPIERDSSIDPSTRVARCSGTNGFTRVHVQRVSSGSARLPRPKVPAAPQWTLFFSCLRSRNISLISPSWISIPDSVIAPLLIPST